MTKEAINGYSYRITQATKSELIVIIYDIAKEYLISALEDYSTDNIEGFRDNLKKAQRAVNELTSSLDLQYEISLELIQLYLYMNKVILKASIRTETKDIDAVIRMIDKLRETFNEVSKQDTSEPLMKNTQKVYAGFTYSNGGINNEVYNQGSNRGFTV